MAKGLGLIGAGLKTKEQAFGALTKSAQEETKNKVMQEQINAQMAAAEMNQAATLTSAGAGVGAVVGGPVGAAIGAAAGFIFSKIF